jgi:hypothetical protein
VSLALIGEWFILLLDVCDAFVTQSNSAKKRRQETQPILMKYVAYIAIYLRS